MKGSFFVVKGLGVLLVGLPSLVVAAALFCWLVSMFLFPALVISAIGWSLWKLPGAIRYRRVKGEWSWTTKAKAKGWEPGNKAADVEKKWRDELGRDELDRVLTRWEQAS